MIKSGYDFLKKLLCTVILVISDMAGLIVSFFLGYYIRAWFFVDIFPLFPPMQHSFDVYLGVWPLLSLWLIMFAYEELYPSIGMSFWRETKIILKSNIVAFITVIIMTFITKTSVDFSRPVIIFALFFSILLLPLMRDFMRTFLNWSGLWSKDVVLIGTVKTVKEVLCNLRKHPDWGYHAVGAILQNGEAAPDGLRSIGTIENLEAVSIQADEVIVAMPELSRKKLVEVVEGATRFAPVVKVLADIYGLASVGVKTHDLDGMLLLEMEDRLALRKNRAVKRTYDVISALCSLIVLSPVFLIVAIVIKLDSRGPVFFGHERVGRGGKPFTCYKFRTMSTNSQELLDDLLEEDPEAKVRWNKDFKLKDDPRITGIGQMLRKTSLDELPQLWNVLQGSMSLVGPRPIVTDEVERYGDKSKYFFKVTPGITGLWQVSGRNDIGYDERVILDEYYAKNWSLWLDIEIILRTFSAVLKKHGAY